MSGSDTIRGQPLLVLAVILGAWLIGRVLWWTPPFPIRALPPIEFAHRGQADGFAMLEGPLSGRQAAMRGVDVNPKAPSGATETARRPPLARPISERPYLGGRVADQQMLLAAAFANPRQPPGVGGAPAGAEGSAPVGLPPSATRAASEARRRSLSGDAWLLWREGSAAAAAPGISAYGRSQAGVVLRYSLLPGHLLVPAIYARVSRTIEGPRQAEVAAGLSLRPLADIPVSVAAEARVTETVTGREVRPAAFAVTHLPPLALPLGVRGDAYLQAGYVGGRFRTAFVDGQGRIDRSLFRLGADEELRAGFAAWGGAQKGAARLDVGPSVSAAFRLGGTTSRIAVDYRLRVAGDAAPASGPAVTFSAGF